MLNVTRPRVTRPRAPRPSPPQFSRSTVHDTLRRLAADRPLFHSEADFQHALAWQLHLDHPNANVRLETRPVPDRPVRVDLQLVVGEHRVALELKYLTKRLAVTVNGEPFELRGHEADDIGRYDFVKDIARLEELADAAAATIGFAVLLTNEPRYWMPGRRQQEAADAAFRLTEDRTLAGHLQWGPTAGPGTRAGRGGISLRGQHQLTWTDYSNVTSASGGSFRYLLIHVSPPPTG